MKNKPRYLINGFKHVYDNFYNSDDHYEYEFLFPKFSRWDFFTDYLLMRKYLKSDKLRPYKVIQINCWENILQYDPTKKYPGQITIAEAHGYFVGVNFDVTLRELPIMKRIPNTIIKWLFDKRMKEQLKKFDIFYVAVPNMLEHAKKIRKDALWLPNPINTEIFHPNGPKVHLEGNPSIFFPTRFHTFKNPTFGIELYEKIKQKYPDAKLHIINYGSGADPLFKQLTKNIDQKDMIIHEKMNAVELSKYYRSADLILGQFNTNLATLGLVELEAMACGGPVIALDKYEIKTYPLENLEKISFKLLGDKKFKNEYVKRNIDYVKKMHSPEGVSKLNIENINRIIKLKKIR